MKPKREIIDYLNDIKGAIVGINRFTKDMKYSMFVRDEKTTFAVVRALEIIGEATKKIPASLKNRYTNVPWREMTGIRDKLIHDYFGINYDVVWKTIKKDIPILDVAINDIISKVKKNKAE